MRSRLASLVASILAALTEPSAALAQDDPLLRMLRSGDALAAEAAPIDESEAGQQSRAMFLAMTGRELEAIETVSPFVTSTRPAGMAVDPAAEYRNALDEIARRAVDHRIIVINEGHHLEQNRWFLHALVERLYPLGYTALTLEALFSMGDGYPFTGPVNHDSGPLMSSPSLAAASDRMISLGGRVYPHESTREQIAAGLDREQAQAENVAAVFYGNPDAKFIVFVGFDHVDEAGHMMAGRLEALTGEDPLTVDQVDSAVLNRSCERPDYPYATIALLSGETLPLGTSRTVDLVVQHPPTCGVEGRPGWLETQFGKTWISLAGETLPVNRPLLIEAWTADQGAPATGVPADRVVVTGEFVPALALFGGAYHITLRTAAGESAFPLVVSTSD